MNKEATRKALYRAKTITILCVIAAIILIFKTFGR